ncbi:uncharacterized protein LOC143597885 [Bidens hawaiensis]|uniref:uncharacterized protein LOC143597885 n=1 Tax=Bidens hawaiensis TaxID=980011 RepID=UPI00404ADC40
MNHGFATRYHSQTSGQVEVSNRHIKEILMKTIHVNRKDWSVKLNDAFWAYQNAYKTPISTTPYRLVYGRGCHLLMELAHRALWEIRSVNMNYNEAGELRKLQLCELEEIRDEAYECSSTYREKLKLKRKWMGLFVITRVGRFGDVEIEDMQDQRKRVVNEHRLKPYLEGKDINMLEVDKVVYILRSLNDVSNLEAQVCLVLVLV